MTSRAMRLPIRSRSRSSLSHAPVRPRLWCTITVALRVEVLVGIQHRTHPGCGNQVKLGFDPVEVITVVLSGRGLNCSPDDAQADQGETAGCQVSDVWPISRALEVMIDEASFRE